MILAGVRSEGGIALATASSGIAALLLTGGSTSYSTFKIPLNVTENSTCNVSKHKDIADMLRRSSLIVWDEVTLSHKHAIETVDRLLRDVMSTPNQRCEVPFGGKVVLFSGDFRQILPVIPLGSEPTIVGSSLKGSTIWSYVQKLHLTVNMRVKLMENSDNREEQKSWGEWLLQVGNGRIANPVNLDVHHIKHCDSIDGLIANVFDDINNLGKTAIVTSLRSDVEQINDIMLQKDIGEIKQYLSIDQPMEEEESQHESTLLPTEFLNTLTPQGMPKHSLKLKIGCPIILLRNLNKAAGLANGTRLVITKLNEYTISGTIVTQGTFCGNEVMIPRIDLIAESKSTPFRFKRRQFPVQVAYCMTIHKSQGQSFDKIGIYLPKDLFTHGQLYVALSRVGKAGGVYMLIKDEISQQNKKSTNNVVFRSALQAEGYIVRAIQMTTSNANDTAPAVIDDVDDVDDVDDDIDDTQNMNKTEVLQLSIRSLQEYLEPFQNPHAVTMSWAIIPLLHSVFDIRHAFQPGLNHYINTVLNDEHAYSKIVHIIKTHFDIHHVTYNSVNWVGQNHYISAEKQNQLLDFLFDINDCPTNIGSYFAALCHDVINLITPPQYTEEI